MSSWLAATQLPDIPDRVRSRATHLLLDGVGCALVGAQLSWSRIAVEAVTALDPGPSPLIGWGGRGASTSSAAMLNSSFVQGFELDDYHPTAPLHSEALVLPVLIATARPDTSGAAALLGAVRAFETGPRIGAALNGGEMLIRGWHSGAVFGPLPAAVAAGTVLSLDAAGFEDALGMAATQAGGLMSAQFESMVKRMQHGFAARNGVLGAALAAAGYVGIKAVLERPYGGYLPVFGEGHDPDPSRVTEGLGELWESERIAIKPYAAMGALHAAIDGALQLRPELMGDDGTLDAVEVSAIDIAMGGGAYEHGGWPARRPLTPIGAQMNVAYTTAVALLDGSVLAAQFSTARIDADDVWSLIDRTRVRHEPAIDRLPPDLRLTTIVGITRSDGTCREVTVSHPKGVGPRALSEAEVVDKYRCLTAGLLEPGRQSAIEAAVLGLEELRHFQHLIDLLTPSVARAID